MVNPFSDAWYTDDASFDFWLACELTLVASTALGIFVEAPYGKHGSPALGSVQLPPRLGWWLMELPATVFFIGTWIVSPAHEITGECWTPYVLAALWCIHYSNRGWFFPLSIRVAKGSTTSFSLTISLIGALFTALHGHLNAKMFRTLGAHYTNDWLTDPRFLTGFAVYEVGFWTTVHSEHVMRNLRPADGIVRDGQRYKIPHGGAFNYVTSAQYLGELTAFLGFACMTWSLPGAAVFIITFFNLVPRSFTNHAWYMKTFGDDYKKLRRKRLVPFVL